MYNVIDIEGIGEKLSAKLHLLGIHTTEDLIQNGATDEQRKALSIELDAPLTVVSKWVKMADLLRVPDIDPQSAELLVHAGIQSIEHLSKQEAASLFSVVKDKKYTLNDVETWTTQASLLNPVLTFSENEVEADEATENYTQFDTNDHDTDVEIIEPVEETTDEHNNLIPTILSIVVGFIVVLLVAGLLMRGISLLRNKSQNESRSTNEKTQQEAQKALDEEQEDKAEAAEKAQKAAIKAENDKVDDDEKVSLWQKIKNFFAKKDEEEKDAQSEDTKITAKVVTPTTAPIQKDDIYVVKGNISTFGMLLNEFNGQNSMLNEQKGATFTFIAPQNDAFAKGNESLQSLLLRNDSDEVQGIVARHIFEGSVRSGEITTLSGETLVVDLNQGTILFNGITSHIVSVEGNTLVVDTVLY